MKQLFPSLIEYETLSGRKTQKHLKPFGWKQPSSFNHFYDKSKERKENLKVLSKNNYVFPLKVIITMYTKILFLMRHLRRH